MSSWKLKAALIISLSFNVAVLSTIAVLWRHHSASGKTAETRHCNPEETCRIRSQYLARGIGLCDSKTVHVELEMLKSYTFEEEVRKNIDRERNGLLMLFHEASPDTLEIMKRVERISALQGDLEKAIVRKLIRSHSILDSEERQRFMVFIGCDPSHGCAPPGHKKKLVDTLDTQGKENK
ncbi:MAG: hypothetical protein KAV42_03230 [Candidatus Krumholzibacteria bacterium]|nr:hypothetical protein [Candidatus Krumholzibacteria bacterium]